MKQKKFKVEIEWELLDRIAEFYEFPKSVFFGNKKMFKHKTKYKVLKKKAELFDKIKQLLELE